MSATQAREAKRHCNTSVYCANGVKCQICRDFDALSDALESVVKAYDTGAIALWRDEDFEILRAALHAGRHETPARRTTTRGDGAECGPYCPECGWTR